ncbi:MAG: hypothetical protein P8Y79_01825 [Ignavibacteriaceae bacterium]
MNRRKKPNKTLIVGSGALQIGQAGEFDYSGSQAITALKEDGITSVLVNPNIATIQTSDNFADKVYFVPITADAVEKVIEKEKPDCILLQFGGQTALNVGVELFEKGILKEHGVEVLGTSVRAIQSTEDRLLFTNKCNEIGLKVASSKTAQNTDEAIAVAKEIGYPVMVRIAYALGGLGSGIVNNEVELVEKATKAFKFISLITVLQFAQWRILIRWAYTPETALLLHRFKLLLPRKILS